MLIKNYLEKINEGTEILVNPKQNELQKLLNNMGSYGINNDKEFKFIYFGNNFYVFDGYRFNHNEIAAKIKLKKYYKGSATYTPRRSSSSPGTTRVAIWDKRPKEENEWVEKIFKSVKLKKEKINEETEDVLNETFGKTFFKNPTTKQIWELVKNSEPDKDGKRIVRWVATNKPKNLYVADAEEYIHIEMFQRIGIDATKKIFGYDFGNVEYKEGRKPLVQPQNKTRLADKDQWIRDKFDIGAINESLQLIKFKYNSKNSHDPKPRVKVLDYEYPGQKGQKTYGKRKDLLGWNTNYYSNKKYAERAIDDIDSFARLLSTNKEEKYKRIKHFFPKQAKLLRRYIRTNMNNLKRKKGWFWKRTDLNSLIKFDKESY